MTTRSYIGMGSNLGDRAGNMRSALAEMQLLGQVRAVSPLYETAPVGYTDQGPFLNAVAMLETEHNPTDLLAGLKDIERRLGRVPGPRNGPRLIDLDILVMEGVEHHENPTLPHPRMHERAFVLRPLLDLAPHLTLPGRGSLKMLLEALPDQEISLSVESLDGPR